MSLLSIVFGDVISKQRLEKGFTQEELAAELSVTRQTVSRWERGYSYPTIPMMVYEEEGQPILEVNQQFHFTNFFKTKHQTFVVSGVNEEVLNGCQKIRSNVRSFRKINQKR